MIQARKSLSRLALVLVLAPFASSPLSAQQPCSSSEYRQFDFWLGQWEILDADNKVVANSSIEKRQRGCVIHENYSTVTGYTGESLNIFDASRGVWHQTWMDLAGALLLIEGGLEDGKMVMGNEETDEDGVMTRQRITWTPLADGTVRQHWQVKVGDADWTDAFDGIYRRKQP